MKAYPLHDIAQTIDPVTLIPTYPSLERVSTWEQRTSLPFEAAFITTADDSVTILCPICPGYIQTPVPWITDAGNGFAQKDFSANCMSCKGLFGREVSDTSPTC